MTLIISNKKMDGIMKILNYLEGSGSSIRIKSVGVRKSVKNEAKK